MSFLRSVLISCLIWIALVHFGSNYIVAQGLERWLGTSVTVGRVHWGLAKHHFIAENIKIHNPSGYSDKPFVIIPRVSADYDAAGLRRGILKIMRLEIEIKEIWLEHRTVSEANVLELYPAKKALRTMPKGINTRLLPFSCQIERVKMTMGTVHFETQLGNDKVHENRKIESPQSELTELTNSDSVAVYAVLLALRSAGWQTFIPARDDLTAHLQDQLGTFVDQIKQQAQVIQAQVSQAVSEKLAQKQ